MVDTWRRIQMYLVVVHIWMYTLVVGIGRLYSSVSSGPVKGGKYFDQSVDSQFLKDSVFSFSNWQIHKSFLIMEYELNDLKLSKQQETTVMPNAFCWFYNCLSFSWSWHTLVVCSVHLKHQWYVCDWSLLPTYYAWNSKNRITILWLEVCLSICMHFNKIVTVRN